MSNFRLQRGLCIRTDINPKGNGLVYLNSRLWTLYFKIQALLCIAVDINLPRNLVSTKRTALINAVTWLVPALHKILHLCFKMLYLFSHPYEVN